MRQLIRFTKLTAARASYRLGLAMMTFICRTSDGVGNRSIWRNMVIALSTRRSKKVWQCGIGVFTSKIYQVVRSDNDENDGIQATYHVCIYRGREACNVEIALGRLNSIMGGDL